MSKQGTIRRIPSQKAKGGIIRAANTNMDGSRNERRKRFKMKAYVQTIWGSKSNATKNVAYWANRFKKRFLRKKAAKQARKLNRY